MMKWGVIKFHYDDNNIKLERCERGVSIVGLTNHNTPYDWCNYVLELRDIYNCVMYEYLKNIHVYPIIYINNKMFPLEENDNVPKNPNIKYLGFFCKKRSKTENDGVLIDVTIHIYDGNNNILKTL